MGVGTAKVFRKDECGGAQVCSYIFSCNGAAKNVGKLGMEFLGHIGIEPKTVLAQIINFLVLVFVLKLVLYKPLLAAFKKRKEAIEKLESDIRDVDKKKTEAEAVYRAKALDGESRANEVIAQARKTVDAFTDTTLEKNREYLDQLLRETKSRIEGAKHELAKLSEDAVSERAFTLASKLLSERLAHELHEKLVRDALRDFEELGSREEDIAFKGTVTVLTAFKLPGNIERHLRQHIQKKFGKKIALDIDMEPGLGAGMIISWGGYRLDGSLRGQLAQTMKRE